MSTENTKKSAPASEIALTATADLHLATKELAEQIAHTLRPHHDMMARLASSLGPVRNLADQVTHAMRPHRDFMKHLQLPEDHLRGLTKTLQLQQEAVERLTASLEPARRLAEQVAGAMRPYQEAVKQLSFVTTPIPSVLQQINRVLRPAFDSGWLDAIHRSFKRFDKALSNSESMGRAGWTVPLNADISECIHLLSESTDPKAANHAFVEFYSKDEGVHLAELVADLLHRQELTEWRTLLEEIVFAVDAGKYRVAVPALLCTFEGVALRVWTDQFHNGPGRAAFFDRKLKKLEPDSYDHVLWRAMKSFVGGLYAQARERGPGRLNRHWILHGREPAAGELADCLRLLQAIHTALTLVETKSRPTPACAPQKNH